jgi:hypothetical protein
MSTWAKADIIILGLHEGIKSIGVNGNLKEGKGKKVLA